MNDVRTSLDQNENMLLISAFVKFSKTYEGSPVYSRLQEIRRTYLKVIKFLRNKRG